jgi:para-aminobenzoate synthetase/4-amino-4-deoxychorismate lyase
MSDAIARSPMSVQRSRPDPARGVFETLLVRDGRALELEAHVARLGSSVGELYGARPPEVRDLVAAAAREVPLGRLRVTVAPNGNGLPAADVRVAAVDESVVFPPFARGVRLSRLDVHGGLGAHKWADRSLLEEAETGDSVALIVDGDAGVLEASRANAFIVEDGAIVTPPADGRILPGVTRARLLELVPVREEPISFARLLAADEVFLTGSVRGVEPVWGLEGGRTWHVGTVTPLVADELRRRWEMHP